MKQSKLKVGPDYKLSVLTTHDIHASSTKAIAIKFSISLPEHYHQMRTKWTNTWTYGGHFSFKTPPAHWVATYSSLFFILWILKVSHFSVISIFDVTLYLITILKQKHQISTDWNICNCEPKSTFKFMFISFRHFFKI